LKDRSLYLAHHLFAFQYLIWSVEGLLLAGCSRSLYGRSQDPKRTVTQTHPVLEPSCLDSHQYHSFG
jgi:hypothetical protein